MKKISATSYVYLANPIPVKHIYIFTYTSDFHVGVMTTSWGFDFRCFESNFKTYMGRLTIMNQREQTRSPWGKRLTIETKIKIQCTQEISCHRLLVRLSYWTTSEWTTENLYTRIVQKFYSATLAVLQGKIVILIRCCGL